MGNEIFILDSEFCTVRDTYADKAYDIEDALRDYSTVIKSIVEEQIMEGRTAQSLQEFALAVELLMQEELASIMDRHKTDTEKFVEDIVEQDDAAI